MVLLTLFLVCLFCAVGVGLMAALADFKAMTIPNSYSAMILGAYGAGFVVLWLFGRADVLGPLAGHLLSGALVFVITLLLFIAKGIGAGDSKLATAFAVWVGLKGLMPFLFYMALIGGALGLWALVLARWKPFKAPKEGGWIARAQAGERAVPYGIAIVGGALVSFVKIGYIGTEVFASFLVS